MLFSAVLEPNLWIRALDLEDRGVFPELHFEVHAPKKDRPNRQFTREKCDTDACSQQQHATQQILHMGGIERRAWFR